ncbi:MAG: hypothetical protein HGA45_38855, partial [Chloroflexales bacterium]|nr:hypothetical protein [Chloroflexales bacterium]
PEPRPGQKEAAQAAYRAIKEGSTLFLQAPTGIGKTMAVLYASLKALGRGQAEGLLARLGGIVAASGGGMLVGHTGFAPQIAVVGPSAQVADAGERIAASFVALCQRAEHLWPGLPPLSLSLQRAGDSAGLDLGILALRAALRGPA